MSRAWPATGKRYVDAFSFDASIFNEVFQRLLFIDDSLRYCLLELLNIRTSLTAPGRINTSDKLLLSCKFAFLPEVFNSQILKFPQVFFGSFE